MATTTIRLSDDLKKRVAKIAEKSGKSAHAVILDAIAQRVAEEENRYAFHEAAAQRFARITVSGETIPWAEMRVFLQDRVAGKPAARPTARKIPS